MKKLTCIICPRGCRLEAQEIDGDILVKGHACPKGEAFAKSELTHPMRCLTTSVKTCFPELPWLPVRTGKDIAKEDIPRILREIRRYRLEKEVHCGDILIENVAGSGSPLIATLECCADSLARKE